jgi:hypothetical protein
LLPSSDCYLDLTGREPAEFAAELRAIDTAADRLDSLHAWRRRPPPPALSTTLARFSEHPFTRLCRLVEPMLRSA